MKLTYEDFKIIPIEIDWDKDGTYYEYWIKKRVWYFFKLFKSNKFILMLNSTKNYYGDSPLSFKTEEAAKEYIKNLLIK